jgi:hypothetical protein
MNVARTGRKWFTTNRVIGGVLALLTVLGMVFASVAYQRGTTQKYRREATEALFLAVENDDLPNATAAFDAGADPNARLSVPRTTAQKVALNSRALFSRKTVADSARRQLAYQGKTVLTAAVLNGSPEMVRLLLQRGAAPDGAVYYADTPLHLAANRAITGESGEPYRTILGLLLAAGADPNAANAEGNTPLMLAIFGKADSRTVRALLEAGADPTQRNSHGATVQDFLSGASPEVRRLFPKEPQNKPGR